MSLFGGGQTIATAETPLSAFNIQSSIYGSPVPILYGRNRVPANLIDYDDFKAIPHTTSQSAGGKGGGGVTSTNTTYTYVTSFLAGLCEGPIASINAFWKDKTYTGSAAIFNRFLGTTSQTAWSTWSTKHPSKALAYRGLVYVAAADYDLGNSASLGNHSFDITGRLPYSAGTIDGANPNDVITDYLTNVTYGSGFPAAMLGSWTQYSNWCIANNVFLSPFYDTQQEARQAITDLMLLTNSGVFFSEGLLKIAPFSDTAATANTVTFTPDVTPAYTLGDDDFLDASQPVRVLRTPNADAWNQVQVEYLDSANQYNRAVATAQDQASIETYGLKPMALITAHQITDAATARLIAQLILQRVLYTRNVYEFKLGWKYCRLEPCDYVTLTDSRLGLTAWPVRVLSVAEDANGELSIQAEDAPAGVTHSPLYTQQPGSGYTVNYGTAPGSVVAPAFFEAPPIKALSGLAIGIAVTGNSADWGGCEIWGSNDGTSYAYVGEISGGARYGTLSNAVTAAVSQVARVALSGNGGQILTGSAADANNLSTLAIIDNEYLAYTGSSLVSANVYDVTLAVRASHNTTAAIHSIGAKFIRIDDAVAYSDDIDLAMIGKTLYFKFLSFNKWRGGKELLPSVTAYSYTITGVMAQLAPPAVSSLVATAAPNGVILTWTNPADLSATDRVEIARSNDNLIANAAVIGSVRGSAGLYVDYIGAGSLTRYYWIRSVNRQGYPSAWLGPQSATSTDSSGVQKVSALPVTAVLGDVVSLTTDHKLYRWNGAAWVTWVDGADILASSVTAGKISTTTLGAIQANLGAINAGQITLDSTSYMQGGQTAYNTGAGFWMGANGGTYKFSIGNSAGDHLTWDGTSLAISAASGTSGARMTIANNVIKVYDSAGTLRVQLGDLTA
jgi:hypothetical protein